MNHSDYIIYVDESGDHSLDTVNPDYPVFVLDFCIFQKEHYVNAVVPKIQAFKFDHFGHDIIILHEHDIRKQKLPFIFLKNQNKRTIFMDDLNQLVEISDFTIVAAVINKQTLTKIYGSAVNPYELGLCFCMEQTFAFLQERKQQTGVTHIMVERRGKREDNELKLAFQRIQDGATPWQRMKMPNFKPVFADKKTNSAGLQLADLTARPTGRHIMDPTQPNRAWDIIEKKLRRGPTGQIDGWGLKVFP